MYTDWQLAGQDACAMRLRVVCPRCLPLHIMEAGCHKTSDSTCMNSSIWWPALAEAIIMSSLLSSLLALCREMRIGSGTYCDIEFLTTSATRRYTTCVHHHRIHQDTHQNRYSTIACAANSAAAHTMRMAADVCNQLSHSVPWKCTFTAFKACDKRRGASIQFHPPGGPGGRRRTP